MIVDFIFRSEAKNHMLVVKQTKKDCMIGGVWVVYIFHSNQRDLLRLSLVVDWMCANVFALLSAHRSEVRQPNDQS